jgi:hypothetical protein
MGTYHQVLHCTTPSLLLTVLPDVQQSTVTVTATEVTTTTTTTTTTNTATITSKRIAIRGI